MGVSFSKSDVNNIYKKQNELVNNASQDCIVSSVTGINNVDIYLENTKIDDIEFAQKTVVDPVCTFENTLSIVAKDIIDQKSDVQNDDTGLLPFVPLGWNIDITNITNQTELENILRNNIYQNCSFTSDMQISDVTIKYVNVKGGDIKFEQEGSVTGQCLLRNLASISAQSDVAQEGDVENGKVRNIGTVIVIIVIIIVVVVAFVALMGALRGRKKKGADDNICAELKGEEKATCELKKLETEGEGENSGATTTPAVNPTSLMNNYQSYMSSLNSFQSSVPSSMPSSMPLSMPSSIPSSIPSSMPSSIPSSMPSLSSLSSMSARIPI